MSSSGLKFRVANRISFGFFLGISLLTLSFSFFSFLEYSVSGAIIFTVFFLRSVFFGIDRGSLFFYSMAVLFLLCNFVIQFQNLVFLEFFKSFMLTLWFLFVYFLSFNRKYSLQMDNAITIRWVSIVVFIVVGVQFFQIFEQFFLSSYDSWFWLDRFSISTAETVGRFEAVQFLGYIRPISIYHEPSYLAFVLLLLYALNVERVHSKLLNLILVVSIILTLSSTVIFFFSIYLSLNFLKQGRQSNQLLLCLGLALLAVMVLVFFPELFRMNELWLPGTSGHERIVVPLKLTASYLLEHPLGLALGQSEVIFNNSFFLIVLYLGVFSPLFFFILLYVVFKKLKNIVFTLKYFTLFGCLLFLSGALFTLEGALFIFFINSLFFSKRPYGNHN